MPVLSTGNLTLADMMRLKDPSGKFMPLVDLLSKNNPLIGDMVFREANTDLGERVTSVTALPGVSWKRANEGVDPSKGETSQFTEGTGMLAGMSVIDVDVAAIGGNTAAARAAQDKMFMSAMNNEVERAMFYESAIASPERINGLTPRFNSSVTLPNQVIKSVAGGVPSGNDYTSIWLVVWGDETVYGIVPKGNPSGLEAVDMGQQLVTDANGKRFRAWVTDWRWRLGLVVKDSRYVVRIANIDTSGLSSTGMALYTDIVDALTQVKDLRAGRPVLYCNRKIMAFLRKQAVDSTKNSTLRFNEVAGHPIMTIDGVPVHQTDALLNTETAAA